MSDHENQPLIEKLPADNPLAYFSAAKFMLSVGQISQLPEDAGAEIAFVGRSNAGKSSALNLLCNQKQLAFSSKTPGRTRLLNFFQLPDEKRLVDLPGYGYAQAAKNEQQVWAKLINDYLQYRTSLRGIVLLMDCRHPLKEQDKQFIDWAQHYQIPLMALLTKADKLSKNQAARQLWATGKTLEPYKLDRLQLFSTLNKIGIDSCRAQILEWFKAQSTTTESPAESNTVLTQPQSEIAAPNSSPELPAS
jgi:GTP-binding protein